MTDLLTPKGLVYDKSSIKPPPPPPTRGLFISSMFEGRLNRREGGGLNNLLKYSNGLPYYFLEQPEDGFNFG